MVRIIARVGSLAVPLVMSASASQAFDSAGAGGKVGLLDPESGDGGGSLRFPSWVA